MPTESSKKWLLEAVNALGNRFMVVSPKFEILAANLPGSVQIPATGKKCHEYFYGVPSPCRGCAVKTAMKTNVPALMPRPEKGENVCQYAFPIQANGRVKGFACMDITSFRHQEPEEAVARSNTFLRKLLVSAVDAVIAADKKGRILIYNEMAGKILGYDADRAVREINIVDLYPEGAAHKIMAALREESREGKGYLRSYLVDVIAEDGQTIPISLNAAIVYDDEQEIATIGYFHDMREELRMKENLEQARLQLLQAEKLASIGLLATGVAHEINNPVAIMIEESGWIEDLLEDEEFLDSPNLVEFNRALKQIHTQGQRCKEITRKLLSFARKREAEGECTDLNRTLRDVAGLSMQRARQNGVTIETLLADTLPNVRVSASEIQQVLSNLINNSLDAMEGSGGIISLSSSRTKDQVLVEVADNGPGISRADQAKIFDPFFTTKPVGKGSGLGLFICYSLIKSMGGAIVVHSESDTGTRFTIRIPVNSSAD